MGVDGGALLAWRKPGSAYTVVWPTLFAKRRRIVLGSSIKGDLWADSAAVGPPGVVDQAINSPPIRSKTSKR